LTQLPADRDSSGLAGLQVDASTHRSIVCYKVAEGVNADPDPPWFGLVVLANQKLWTKREKAEDPSRENRRIINANSFVDGLRPVHDYLVTHMIAARIDEKVERIQSVITEFWSALKTKLPEAFESPSEFALFKSGGVGPLHFVLRELLGKMHVARRDYTRDEFLTMIEGCASLSDAEFWRSDNDRGARISSGKANWADLAKRIIRDMDTAVAEQ
jgi:hypothetical protein